MPGQYTNFLTKIFQLYGSQLEISILSPYCAR